MLMKRVSLMGHDCPPEATEGRHRPANVVSLPRRPGVEKWAQRAAHSHLILFRWL